MQCPRRAGNAISCAKIVNGCSAKHQPLKLFWSRICWRFDRLLHQFEAKIRKTAEKLMHKFSKGYPWALSRTDLSKRTSNRLETNTRYLFILNNGHGLFPFFGYCTTLRK